jgi:hypothetical protein
MGFICSLTFPADLTSHLNVLNLNLQGKGLNISQLVSHIEGFHKKLKLFEDALQKKDTTHFPSCQQLKESENYFIDFCRVSSVRSFLSIEKISGRFWKMLSQEKFPKLRNSFLEILELFGSTYVCEAVFYTMNVIR